VPLRFFLHPNSSPPFPLNQTTMIHSSIPIISPPIPLQSPTMIYYHIELQ
jgi:hypothetical protein